MPTTKLTSEIALSLVESIEAYQDKIAAVYAEANTYNGNGNSNLIRDAVKARAAAREAEWEAQALLASVDAEEND